jgi:hypothetical protein
MEKQKRSTSLKWVWKVLKAAAPDFFHKCPYVGLHSITNMTALKQYLTFAPIGTFRGKLSVTDGDNFLYGYTVYLTAI